MRHRPCPECDGFGSVRVRSTRTHHLLVIHCPHYEGTGKEAQ